jgi:hypothetical protein
LPPLKARRRVVQFHDAEDHLVRPALSVVPVYNERATAEELVDRVVAVDIDEATERHAPSCYDEAPRRDIAVERYRPTISPLPSP